jgi:hypothetical protein
MQGNCGQPFAIPSLPLKPRQCVLTLPLPLLGPRNFPRAMILANIYARAVPSHAPGPIPKRGSVVHTIGGLLWLANVTIEGSADSFLSAQPAIVVNGTVSGVPAQVHMSGASLCSLCSWAPSPRTRNSWLPPLNQGSFLAGNVAVEGTMDSFLSVQQPVAVRGAFRSVPMCTCGHILSAHVHMSSAILLFSHH